MSYKDILVLLDAGPDLETRMDAAIDLCRRFDAQLLGVDVSTPQAFSSGFSEKARHLQDIFEERINAASVIGEYRAAGSRTSSWKDFYTHYTDLVVASQSGEESEHIAAKGIPDEIVASAGVPVIVLPGGWTPATLGESVVIAWNSTREATRALHDALPILRQAARVTIFEHAPPSDHVDDAPKLVQTHLAHHGIEAEIFTWPDDANAEPIDTLFTCIDRQRADLIVAGGFGHPKVIENLFGSMSRELLHNWTVPVLMSH
ncbi:universal stress protein [Paraburkholderia sp. J12]|uniref:universal stress protein n=1 Tax=Paraburkholderia sp. J12 TaxID=2805432 RepID=UPI002ABD581D|nr:universal stress protein [Paraburkholderia sp. J12]